MSYISWYSVICLITGISPYPGNIPSIPDCPKYCIIIAYTVTVLLPMRVLHGTRMQHFDQNKEDFGKLSEISSYHIFVSRIRMGRITL